MGHSNHEPGPFFALLARYGVRALVDVRSIPSSGRFPHFKKRSLETLCRGRGVSYRHCPELGNKVGGIAQLLRQPEGQAALAELAAAAKRAAPALAWEEGRAPEGATAYMCAEADWRDCHRQVIAQELLSVFSIPTIHILRDGSTELHPCDHVLPSHYGMAPGAHGAGCPDSDDEALAMQLGQLSVEGADEVCHANGAESEVTDATAQAPGSRRWRADAPLENRPSASEVAREVQSTEGAAATAGEAANATNAMAQPRSRRWGKRSA